MSLLRWVVVFYFQGLGKGASGPEERLRVRIKDLVAKSDLVVAVLVQEKEMNYAKLTLPIWRAYCEKHKFDFLQQEEKLDEDLPFEWSRPLFIKAMLAKKKWKWIWTVDANSLPVKFGKSVEYVIQNHAVNYPKHYTKRLRVVWCPENCEEGYKDKLMEGACYGPFLSGCLIKRSKKASEIMVDWHKKAEDFREKASGLAKALDRVRTHFWDEIRFEDVGTLMGKGTSSFLQTYTHSKEFGYDIRRMVEDVLQRNKKLGDVANMLDKREEL
eukprot:gnl/MRDRNA2_/MRDRNA2_76543_c0_seq1.p1 gnl/MRDRNA2_/MRDRNA2_76543_c0~~gnl/MRDRNA2_/MRDRNA2_76543_c0_seq1.p1  ORF type:complete len:296 (+),score=65.24 gnl/MRDRNA2_/MRDRNA2_76543_c0_seq1:77-889(+)